MRRAKFEPAVGNDLTYVPLIDSDLFLAALAVMGGYEGGVVVEAKVAMKGNGLPTRLLMAQTHTLALD